MAAENNKAHDIRRPIGKRFAPPGGWHGAGIDILVAVQRRHNVKPRPDLAIESLDGELIVLDKAAGAVHQLNASASFVWNYLGEGLAADEIARLLAEAFDIEPNRALSDVQAAIAEFTGLELIVE